MWFEDLMGFKEENPEQVRNNIILENEKMISKINGKTYQYGHLEIISLKELKKIAPDVEFFNEKISLSEIVEDVRNLHKEEENRGALFQVASQINLLEMTGPEITPEMGVGIYEYDFTQGPACAIACGAGTIYRNYFVKIGNQLGQTKDNQINCLEDLGKEMKNEELSLWRFQNGYVFSDIKGLRAISEFLNNLKTEEYERLKGKLKIGIQWDVEVTIADKRQIVSQAYCSALPVAYSEIDSEYWEDFARFILEASYEATFYAGLINYAKRGNKKLYLTLLGGGAFGNKIEWISDAIKKAVIKFKNTPLDVKIVSYGKTNPKIKELITQLNEIF